MKATHVTVSNAEFYEVLREDAVQGETNWTVNSRAARGDRILLYICAPVSSIVATGILATDAEENDDPSDVWFGHYLADIHSLTMLAEPVTRKQMLLLFPAWGYWKQPRNCVRVPEQFLPALDRLLGG